MALIVFDTNIFIDMLHGVHEATVELLSHGAPLVTRNGKDFSRVPLTIHTPYDYDSATGAISNVRPPFDLGRSDAN